ncbi:MAG TPA: two-component regulator propeller domain-containing protein [Chitinophagaceae bacterium]|nr:two-component regulator propeller domain-containing protein [Chitinophagaceae bacterium]
MATCLSGLGQNQDGYLFSHIGTNKGLLSDEVTGIEQDAQGFIWISSLDGLQRYDGRRFISFQHRPGVTSTLANDKIHWMTLDKRNRLWLILEENIVGYFNITDLSFHAVPIDMPPNRPRNGLSHFVVDKDSNIILLTLSNEARTYDEKAHEFTTRKNPFAAPPNWHPQALLQDKTTGDYWIGCDSGLAKFDKKNRTLSYRGHNTDADPVIEAYSKLKSVALPYLDRQNRFWLYSWPQTGGGPYLYSFNKKTKEMKDWEKELFPTLKYVYHEIYRITEEENGTFWLTGSNVFARLNPVTDKFEPIRSNLPGEFSIRYDAIARLFEDREHNIWLGTNEGVYRFNPSFQNFTTIHNRLPTSDSVFAPDVTDILQAKSGEILVSTWGNGLFAYSNDFKPLYLDYINKQSKKLGEAMPWCIHQRKNGDIWRGAQAGVLFITKAATMTSAGSQLPVFEQSTIRQITEDSSGNLWLGTQGGHIVKWDAATNVFTRFQHWRSTIQRLYTDRRGNIWACTATRGVFELSAKDGSIINQYTAEGPEGKRLMSSMSTDIIQFDDSLYVIGSGGLNILNITNNNIRYLPRNNDIPSHTVSNIVMDRKGYLWVTTQKGVCSVKLGKESVVTTYNENDGVNAHSFSSASSCMLADGRIAIGTPHDILVFDPAKLTVNGFGPAPDINITGVYVMNRWLKPDSLGRWPEIELPYDQNSITIEYSTLTFLNSYGVYYKLDDIDKSWLISGRSEPAVYNYLPPGNYTFKAYCTNSDGVPSRIMAELHIKVRSPFWETWWFYALLALAVAALLYFIDRQRINRLKDLQKVRADIASNLHEDVNTTLNNINLLGEMAKMKADKDIDRSKEYIDQISTKSHNMIIAMDDILWSIDPENDSMEKTLLRMMEFTDAMKNRHDASIQLVVDKKVRSLKLDMKIRHEFFLIFKEGLRMISQFANGKDTLINVDLFRTRLSLKLQDATARLDTNIDEIEKCIREINDRSSTIRAESDIQYDKSGIAIILLIPVK